MHISILEERADTPDAMQLIAELDDTLNPFYPPESRHGYSVEKLLQQSVTFFVLRCDDRPAGCVGVQRFGRDYAEIKRMFVRADYRGLGLGKRLLDHLAQHTRQHGITVLRLETGIHQEAAVRLYEGMGFVRCSRFGDYPDDPLSLFYEKQLG